MTYMKFTNKGVSRLINIYDETSIAEAVADGFIMQTKGDKPITVESEELASGIRSGSKEDVIARIAADVALKNK